MARTLPLLPALLSVALCVALVGAVPQSGLGTLGTEDGGSCGFTMGWPASNVYVTGFSSAIYGAGSVCGGCFVVQCTSSPQCRRGAQVIVTATNECMAQNTSSPCVNPKAALNLQPRAYDLLATSRAPGVVGATWRPVACVRTGGVQFQVTTGDKYYLSVLIQNVAGPGALSAVYVKAGNLAFAPMTRSYGAVWQVSNYDITAKALSFLLVGYNGSRLLISNALQANWVPQRVYTSPLNFNMKPRPLPAKKATPHK